MRNEGGRDEEEKIIIENTKRKSSDGAHLISSSIAFPKVRNLTESGSFVESRVISGEAIREQGVM